MTSKSGPGWVRRLLPWLRPHRRNVVLSFGAALVGSAIAAAVPAIERQIVDKVIVAHDSPLAPWLGVLALAAVVTFVAAHIRRYVGGRVSLDVQYDLRNAIYNQLQRLDFARHDEMQTGQLVSRANSDVGLLQGLLAFLPIMSGNVLLLVLSIVIMFVLSPLLALIALAVVPALALTAYRMREKTFPASWDSQQREGEIAVVVEEAVTGVRVVKGFGQEERELQLLVQRAEALYGSRLRAVRLQARYQPVLQAIPVLGEVMVLALGGWMAIHNEITLGTFLAFATYLLQLASPARMLAGVLIVAQQARAGTERVLDLLASNPIVRDGPDAEVLPPVRGRDHLRRCSFRVSEQPAGAGWFRSRGEPRARRSPWSAPLDRVSRRWPCSCPGSTTYRMERSAWTGWTSAMSPWPASRSQIGVVFEESFLFSDTVRANIAYARPDASDAEVEVAARAAEAHGFITDLPEGYDTVVGERGLTLSGGQRQRIALARALLSDPQILILDDATSAVDARIEAEIHATLQRVMEGRTTLLVAHRRSTLRLADRVAVVESGRVVDHGSHAELMARCAAYRLLLSGPGEDAEGVGALGIDEDESELDGVTRELWPYDRLEDWSSEPADDGAPTSPAGAVTGAGRLASGSDRAGLGRLGHGATGRGGGGSWLGAMAATPELLARVAALPPIRDVPDVEVAEEARYDPAFSLRRFIRPYRRPLAAGFVLVVLDALATLAGPLLIKNGLDKGVANHSEQALFAASAIFLAITLLDWLDSIAQVMITGKTAERLLLALRVRIWAHLQRLSIDFYEREMAGRIMTRMTTDVDALSTLLQSGLINALVSLLTLVGVGVALILWNVELGLATLSVVLPLAVATIAYRRLSARAYERARERIATVNASMQEGLSGVRESQAFGRERHNEAQFKELAGGYLDARLAAQRLVSLYFPFVEFLADMAAVLVLGLGSVLVARGSLTSGELVGFLLYLDLFFNPHPAAVPDLRLLSAGRRVDGADQQPHGHPASRFLTAGTRSRGARCDHRPHRPPPGGVRLSGDRPGSPGAAGRGPRDPARPDRRPGGRNRGG